MLWGMHKEGTLLDVVAHSCMAWTRRRGCALDAIEPCGISRSDVPAKKLDDAAPRVKMGEAPDALRLSPEAGKLLLDAGMPPEGSPIYDGCKRAADTPEVAASKFVIWARAVGATGTYPVRTISALYWECAEVDHREPIAIDRFLRALKSSRGVRMDLSSVDRRRRVWIIEPAEAKRIVKAQAALAAKVVAKSPQAHPNFLRFAPEQDHSSPQLLRAAAHDARRHGRARKQRGSRNLRWAA